MSGGPHPRSSSSLRNCSPSMKSPCSASRMAWRRSFLLFRCELKTPVVLWRENGDGRPFFEWVALDDDLAFDHLARYKSHTCILPRPDR